MRLVARIALLLVVCLAFVPAASASGNVNFVLGQRSLDEDYWAPVEDQDVFGVNVDFGGEDWPINLVVGVFVSSTESSGFDPIFVGSFNAESEQQELSFGVIKVWDNSSITRPYISGGLSYINAEIRAAPVGFPFLTDDDSAVGLFADVGVFWRVGKVFNIGIEARIVRGADVTLFTVDGDADYGQYGLILGWGWGGSHGVAPIKAP